MDLHCKNCNEPWNEGYIQLKFAIKLLTAEHWEFKQNKQIIILHCPCCHKKMKRSDLKPNQRVRHIISKQIGTVRPNPKNPNQLMKAGNGYVRISRRPPTKRGEEIKKIIYTSWLISNIEPE